jgi:phenylpyruvate tautomerase PptA (4-oxalocrotonate tautomerase family)
MPYIAINTDLNISEVQKEMIKTELGNLITIIPSKTESLLMIDFSENRAIYKAGLKESGVFIDLRLFHKSEFEVKKEFTEKTIEMIHKKLNVSKENIYLTIMEFDNWGSGGTLKL